MQENLLRDVGEDFKRIIADSIAEAIGPDLSLARKNFYYKTNNYQNGLIWDLIIENLIAKTNRERIEYHIFKRGPWAFIILLDKQSGFLYTFMREERLTDLLKDKKREQPHYIDSLVQLNDDLKAQSQQMPLPGIPSNRFEKEYLLEKLNELCGCLLDKCANVICKHAIITFSFSKNNLTLLKANILNTNLDMVIEENWDQYILPKYDFDLSLDDNEPEPGPNHDGHSISLKPEALQKLSQEKLSKLKEAKKEKLKTMEQI